MNIVLVERPYIPQAPGTNGALVAVLTKDGAGCYAAYVGIARGGDNVPEDQQIDDVLWIAERGRKLQLAEASTYFVGLKASNYRA